MPCYHPQRAYRSAKIGPSGKRGITFSKSEGFADLPVELPCNRCIGCRIDHSEQNAVRCYHESQMHSENCFITLTYADEHLPEDNSVQKRVWQLFMKRLRKYYAFKKIRFFMSGEYGEKEQRAHYHALLFGHDFADKKLWKVKNGHALYTSETLDKIWGFGFTTVADCSYQTAAYTARYVTKKIGGHLAAEHYLRPHPISGKLFRVQPEFSLASRRPGIGATWYDKYSSDAFPSDFVIVDGKKKKPPRYYLKKLEEEAQQALIKGRKAVARKHKSDNTPERRRVRETVKLAALQFAKRTL